MNYDKRNGDVCFREEDHAYFNERKPDICYTSVTTLIGKYHEKFDGEFWARYKAFEECLCREDFIIVKSKYLRNKKADIDWFDKYNIDIDKFNALVDANLAKYKLAGEVGCARGSEYHLKKELAFYEKESHELKTLLPNSAGSFHCQKHNWDLTREKAVIPEFLVYYHSPDGLLNIAGQIDLMIKDGNDIYILDYKGLPLDTPIATPCGWSTINDIEKGDKIFDKDGNQVNVLNVSDIHYNPCYKIKFDNGEELIADHEHRWEVSFRKSRGVYNSKIMTTEEINKWIVENRRDSFTIPRIMNAKPINTPDVDLPIDPYVFGAWLGDGSKSCGIITNVNPDFWNEIKKRKYDVSHNLSGDNRAEMRTVYGISPKLRSLGVLGNKHIPDIYLRSSYSQRLDLLRGLMDTDGYYNEKRKRFVMATGQKWQAEDVAKIVSSLGWKPTIIYAKKKCNDKIFDGWDVCFTTVINPFLIRNQDIKVDIKSDNNSSRSIVSVIPCDMVPTKCLEVDSPSHTFLAGYNLIVTHNTNAKGIKDKPIYDPTIKKYKTMYYPINNLNDTMLVHYTLQLSLYAWMIQKLHPEFNIKLLKLLHIDGNDIETDYEVPYIKEDIERLLKQYKKTLQNERHK